MEELLKEEEPSLQREQIGTPIFRKDRHLSSALLVSEIDYLLKNKDNPYTLEREHRSLLASLDEKQYTVLSSDKFIPRCLRHKEVLSHSKVPLNELTTRLLIAQTALKVSSKDYYGQTRDVSVTPTFLIVLLYKIKRNFDKVISQITFSANFTCTYQLGGITGEAHGNLHHLFLKREQASQTRSTMLSLPRGLVGGTSPKRMDLGDNNVDSPLFMEMRHLCPATLLVQGDNQVILLRIPPESQLQKMQLNKDQYVAQYLQSLESLCSKAGIVIKLEETWRMRRELSIPLWDVKWLYNDSDFLFTEPPYRTQREMETTQRNGKCQDKKGNQEDRVEFQIPFLSIRFWPSVIFVFQYIGYTGCCLYLIKRCLSFCRKRRAMTSGAIPPQIQPTGPECVGTRG
ncbi:hypothetical protein WN48_05223 [Eufriesea mexicana]|uniref:Uncharacterized protein n=1 Tax=Eufriesea mexicana TaxID=516756 RepID=A0A310SN34_9HYME|nr:hypothetical protein WN48_05223 [Eufriesea mexicana]